MKGYFLRLLYVEQPSVLDLLRLESKSSLHTYLIKFSMKSAPVLNNEMTSHMIMFRELQLVQGSNRLPVISMLLPK